MTAIITGMRNTKTDSVFRNLRQMIIDLDLKPGQAINKERLTEQFGVSRAPLNDALARLREEDLVSIAPQHGTFVQHITIAKLKEGLFFRRAVEPRAMAALAPVISDSLIGQLQENLARQRSAVAANDLSALHSLDDAFHSLLLGESAFEHTVRLVRTFSAHLERARNLAPPIQRNPDDTVRDHENIVKALSARDAKWAESAMDIHLASALSGLRTMIEKQPELFETELAAVNFEAR